MTKDSVEISLRDMERAPDDVEGTPKQVTQEEYTNLMRRFTELSEKNIKLIQEQEALLKKVNTAHILDSLITPYANRTYIFMVAYCAFVGAMLFMSSMDGSDVHIDDEVMKILVGSTAVTVIGLVGMILTGVFVGARKA